MKVVCVNKGSYHLTVGKVYDVEESPVYHETDSGIRTDKLLFNYFVTNDKGYQHFVEGDLFIPLDDVRDKKLNILGI